MFDRWLKVPAHHYLYLIGLALIVIGLPLNKVVLSTGSIWVVANWILEGDFKRKWGALKSCKILYPLYLLLIMHFISLLYAEDFAYAFHDLKIKLPFFSLPVILITSKPLSLTKRNIILSLFVLAVIFTTVFNYFHFVYHPENFRAMSVFVSHIRLSWMIVLSIAILVFFIYTRWQHFAIWSLPIVWLVGYLLFSQSLTGLLFLGILLFTAFVYLLFWQKRIWLRWSFLILIIAAVSYVTWQITSILETENQVEKIAYENLDRYSAQGNEYFNDPGIAAYENGHLVFIHYAEEEMVRAWNQRSELDGYGPDKKGNQLKYTLLRYLTSKGLKKDSVGVYQLSEKDIQNVENGMPNYQYAQKGVFFRLAYLINLYWSDSKKMIDPNGNSILQRKEHYKAGLNIIKHHFWLGVGNGNILNAYEEAYQNIDTKLRKEFRHRIHNQYLTFWISFGIPGFLVFVVWVIAPLIKAIKLNQFLPILFFVMLIFIAGSEDVLETHVGVTFVSFFYGFLLPGKKV